MSDPLIPPIYRMPLGLPLYWGDEMTGELRGAVLAYLNPTSGSPTPRQLELLRAYILHHIHAPCWLANPHATPEYCAQIGALQQQAAEIRTVDDVHAYIEAALDLGLDPL